MKTLKRICASGALLLAVLLLVAPLQSQAQDAVKRRVVNRVAPVYPALARTMSLQGSVKIDALVSSDGTVKSLEVKGGHPLLGEAAADAVRRWRWEPLSHESHELVEVRFSPQ